MQSKLMEEKRTVANAVWIAALAGLLVGSALSLVIIHNASNALRFPVSAVEDEPIVVAGGSMHIRAAKGKFDVKRDKAVYEHSNGRVTAIDVLYYDNAGPAFDRLQIGGARTAVSLNYCDSRPGCSPATIETEPDGHGLTFSPVGNDPMSDGNRQISHVPEDGYIDSVTVDQKVYACRDSKGQKGKCTVVIHYCSAASCN
jgi:hypothetical protein